MGVWGTYHFVDGVEGTNRLFKGSMWHADATHNTLITTGNGGTEQTRAQATLYYEGGEGEYRVEKLLLPGQQLWLDVGQLIHNQVPDSDGKVLPPDTMFGSYELRDLDHPAVGLLYEGKLVIDKTYGHAAYGCARCCGLGSAVLSPDPIGGPPGLDFGDTAQAPDMCQGGSIFNVNYYAYNWNSQNTKVATLPSPTLHTVAPGSTTGATSVKLQNNNARDGCPPIIWNPGQGVTVVPTISGPRTVWWLNGQDPNSSPYPTSVTLTSSGGSSTTWSVAQADARVNLSSTSGASISVTGTGSHFSGATGDISVTATANGVSSSPFTMTAKTPWKLVSRGAPQTSCFSSPETYTSTVSYDVHDNLDVLMSANIDWNEVLGSQTSENGSNWGRYSVVQSAGSTDPVQDLLAPPKLNVSPPPVPTPTCSGQNSGATRYRSIPQNMSVGTVNNGSGVHVQSDTLGYYVDHGQHDGIQVPAQPPQ